MLHICHSRKLITENLLEVYKEEFEMFKPVCSKCEKELGVGDYVDGFFPYEYEYDICKDCRGD